MRREIKFRGKCLPDSKYAGEWVTGGYVPLSKDITPNNEGLIMRFIGGNTTITYHVDPDTVGQFTGLYDKNGVEIYEGDVIQEFDSARTFEVIYEAPEFCMRANIFGYRFLNHPENFEVVGNMHDDKIVIKVID